MIRKLFQSLASAARAISSRELWVFTHLLGSFCYDIEKSTELLALEGLPDPGKERDLFEREKAAQKTVEVYEHSFYGDPLEIPSDLAEGLRELSAAPNNYSPLEGSEAQGPFHPNFMLAWKAGERTCYVLLALEVKQARFITGKTSLRVRIRNEAHRKFVLGLTQFRSERRHRI